MFREIIILNALLAVGLCTVVHSEPCTVSDTPVCTVKEVRIDPCKNPRKCLLKKGKGAAISFDYVPNFSASNLGTGVYWNNVEFKGLDSNACSYTTCPVEVGQQYTLNYTLLINKKLPSGIFPVQWKVWDASNIENVCCFNATLKLDK